MEIVVVGDCRRRGNRRFNGATFFQTWKCPQPGENYHRRRLASMEPRFFKRGNRLKDDWRLAARQPCFNGATFFQTWKFVTIEPDDNYVHASMEPRFFKRGNGELANSIEDGKPRFNGATFFQTWKSSLLSLRAKQIPKLQWSHVFSNVEMIAVWALGLLEWRAASMEPRFFKRGNCYYIHKGGY